MNNGMNNSMNNTIPCATCGKPTRYSGTKRCDNCWAMERCFEQYMRAPKAWHFVRKHLPKLDDWGPDGPDGWDYEEVLRENHVTVEWCDKITVDGETFQTAPPELCGWGFYWEHGSIHIGHTSEIIAHKAAALFVSLWLRGVSASFCVKLMDGYIGYLERQKG